MRIPICLSLIAAVSCQAQQVSGPKSDLVQSGGLKIVVVQGEGAENNLRTRNATRATAWVASRRIGAGSRRHSSGSHGGGGPGSRGTRRLPLRERPPDGVGAGVTSCAPRLATDPQPFRTGAAAPSASRLRRGAGLRGRGDGLMRASVARAGRDEAPVCGGFVVRNPAATYSPGGPPPKYHRRWRA